MRTRILPLCLATLFSIASARAATLYVDAASTNAVPPFTNWATAAANIQDAVDAAAPGDEIVVTNGVYQTGARAVYGMSNRVAVTKPVTVRSVNGPAYTSIVGHGPIGDECDPVRVSDQRRGAGGFTLTNGATQVGNDTELDCTNQSGGGVWCEALGAVVSNSLIVNWTAAESGGGACGGNLNNCTLTGNSAILLGGGVFNATVKDCTITRNHADFGGGASRSTLDSCAVTGNSGTIGGGAHESALKNCTVTGNTGYDGGGADSSTLTNCTVTANSAWERGGGAFQCHALNSSR